jgi:hypothetical protein
MQHYAHFLIYGEGAKKNWKSLTLSTQFGIRILHDIPLVGESTKVSDKSHLKVITCFRLLIKYPEFLIFDIQQIFISLTRNRTSNVATKNTILRLTETKHISTYIGKM